MCARCMRWHNSPVVYSLNKCCSNKLQLRRPTYAAKRAQLYKKLNSRSIAPSQRARVLYNIKRLQANRPKRLIGRPSSIAKRSPQLQEQRYTVRFEKGGILRGFGKELMNSILPGIFRQGVKNNATTPNNNTISNKNGAKKNQSDSILKFFNFNPSADCKKYSFPKITYL